MNGIELRYEIFKPLKGVGRRAGIISAEMIEPSPANPALSIEVVTDDPYDLTNPDATRRFRVTVEEITEVPA